MNSPVTEPRLRFDDKLRIAMHEITVAAIIASDLIEKRQPTEQDFQRFAQAARRLRALGDRL